MALTSECMADVAARVQDVKKVAYSNEMVAILGLKAVHFR